MSTPGNIVRQTLMNSNPELKDVLDQLKKDIFISLNCHHIGTVQKVNYDEQTVDVSINYQKTFFQNPSPNTYNPVLKPYPLLLDCPFVVLGGGVSRMTFPIKVGDECLVLFNDRNMDNWFQGSTQSGNLTARQHSLADGIALVGIRSLNKRIQDYDEDRAELINGNAKVSLSTQKIKLANNLTTLNTLLQTLLTQIQAITVTTSGSPSGVPNNAAAFAALATQIGGLLE